YSRANKGKATYERDLRCLNQHLSLWANESLDRITPKMCEDFKISRIKVVKPGTVNRDLHILKAFFNKAVEWGYLESSPAKGVKPMKLNKAMERFLSQEEANYLLCACKESDNPHLYAIVSVALHTGMRLGEVLGLQWEDVDFKRGRIQVASRATRPTKTRESRSVPMNHSLAEVLRRHPRRLDTPYLFYNQKGEPFEDVDNWFRKVRRRMRIPHFRFHDLRHTFASTLIMAGVDIRTVAELLGHKDISMTMRYSHLAPDHMRKAVEVLDGHYLDTGALAQGNVNS
ncbi:MAG TPA: tyrosine-type recombinase/integrase, partial [Desulfomonilaceae bacterium]|nr:tyrosine-type recombinase/integrase [Desulfomonilaceae bacterium]